MRCAPLVLSVLLAAAPIAAAMQPSTAVYKCTLADGAIVYQDYACSGGVVVDIKPDVANPDAIARLERARIESERATALRKIDEAAAAMRRNEGLRRAPETEIPVEAPDSYIALPGTVYAPAAVSRLHDTRRSADPRRHHGQRSVRPDRRVPATIRRPHRG